MSAVRYVGFWARVGASLVDTLLILLLIVPLALWLVGPSYFNPMRSLSGAQLLLEWLLPAVAVLLFWLYRSATPGKMLIHAVIVDAATLGKPGTGQFVGRYLGYIVSTLPLGLGLLWVAWDPRKQGWHDKLARTLVIRKPGG